MAETFFKRVENTKRKGEIAHYVQFLLFSLSVFKRLVLQTRKNHGLLGKAFINHSNLGPFSLGIIPIPLDLESNKISERQNYLGHGIGRRGLMHLQNIRTQVCQHSLFELFFSPFHKLF